MSDAPSIYANKDELARALDWAKPTLDAFLKDHPDAPVVTRGSNGVPWEFDVAAFMDFVARISASEEEALSAKRAELDKWRLPLGIEQKADSAKDVVSLLKANKLAREAGLLVPVSEMRQKALSVLAAFARFLDYLPAQLGRKHQLPDAVVRSLEQSIADQRELLIKEIQALFAEEPPDMLRNGTRD